MRNSDHTRPYNRPFQHSNWNPGFFKMERESLHNNPITSYLYLGQYKFRVSYQGQNTICGYCAEDNHVEKNSPKKANMKIVVKNSKLHRRQAFQNENEQKEPPKRRSGQILRKIPSTKKKKEKKLKPTNALSPIPTIHRSTTRRNANIRQPKKKSGHYLI